MRACSILVSALVLTLAACGGGGDTPTPDAAGVVDVGFTKPDKAVKANKELGDDSWMELGAADFSCLNTMNADVATTVPVALATTVLDFQSDNLVPNASIEVFPNQDVDSPFDTATSSGDDATVTINIPVGIKRFGYRLTDAESLDTLLLNQKVEPDMMNQTEGSIRTVSKATAATMPALIGISRTPGTGVIAGAMRDCQDREVSNFIATVVTQQGATTGTHAEIDAQNAASIVPGTDTYYFSSSVGLPVRHTQKAAASEDGLFMVVELGVAPTAFVQVWGYVDDADLAADKLTLLAELQTESIGDTVITGSYEPLRQ